MKLLKNTSELNIVRIGSYITHSSLKEIGDRILNSLRGVIQEYKVFHYDSLIFDKIDAQLLTMVLADRYAGHILGITDADLMTDDEFYNSIFGGKNTNNDVAVVSTNKLAPDKITSDEEYELFISRTIKVALHEVGHNLGLIDHGAYKQASDGTLCLMSRGEFNKFGILGYVKAIIDGRGFCFCDDCVRFLQQVY